MIHPSTSSEAIGWDAETPSTVSGALRGGIGQQTWNPYRSGFYAVYGMEEVNCGIAAHLLNEFLKRG